MGPERDGCLHRDEETQERRHRLHQMDYSVLAPLAIVMSECPLFRFESVPQMVRDPDRILCASLWQHYLVSTTQTFGTEKGVVFIFEHEKKLVHTVAYQKAVRNIHCFNACVAFTCEDTVVLYDIENESDTIHTSEQGVKCVQVNSADSSCATALAATSTEVLLLQNTWTYARVLLYSTRTGIEAIRVCGKYLAVQCTARVVLLSIASKEVLSEVGQRNLRVMTWIAPDMLGVGTNQTFQFLKVSAEGVLEGREELTQKCESPIAELAGFYLEFALALGTDRVLRLLETNGSCQALATDKWARIVSDTSLARSFFLVFESGMEKVTANSEAEKLQWFLDQFRFREAFNLMEKRKLPKEEIFNHCRAWLLHIVQHESEAECRDVCTELLDKETITPETLLQLIDEELPLLPLITEVPSSAITDRVAASVIAKLVQHSFEPLVIHCIGTWDPRFIQDEQIMEPVVSSSMNHAKVQLFLACNYISAALRVLFYLKSEDLFAALRAHQAGTEGFLKGLTREELAELVKIDRKAAIKLLGRTDYLDPEVVAREIPSEDRGKYLEKRWAKGMRRSPNTDSWLLEHRLKTNGDVLELINTSTLLDKERALELCVHYSHVRGQTLLLNRLGRGEEIKAVLSDHFEELVLYLKTRWDAEIWKHVLERPFSQNSHGALLSISHMQMENEGQADLCDALPDQSRMLRSVKELLTNMRQGESLKKQYFKAAVSSLSAEQTRSFKKLSRGVYVEAGYRCTFCSQPMTEFALFRRCGHHVHIECDIDEDCRFCEKSSARC